MSSLVRRVSIMLGCAFALLAVAWCDAPAAAALPPDVPGDHWAAPSVARLTAPDVRLVDLFPNGTFRGAEKLAKYDLVKSLDNLAQHLAREGVPLALPQTLPPMPYADVPADHYAAPSIRRLLQWIPGNKSFFVGRQTMTRLDMAVWLYSLLKGIPQAQRLQLGPELPDVAAPWSEPARWALAAGESGLISRYPDGAFRPTRELSRYEMAFSLHAVLKWATKLTDKPPVGVEPQDRVPPEMRLTEPSEVEDAKDFVVVRKVKQLTVAGLAADDTGIQTVTVNGANAALASADADEVKKAGLTGPAGSRFRVEVPAPGEEGRIEVVVTDGSGKTAKRAFRMRPPKPDAPRPEIVNPAGTQRAARKWAVLVGVNEYDDVENIPTLRYSVADVTKLHALLVDPTRGGFAPDGVFLLTDNTPTKPTNISITKALNQVARLAEPNDMVLFYFSGHGYEENGRGYILPKNADVEALSASAVDNNDLTDLLDRMKAHRIITIIDACHSGSVKRTGTSAPPLSGQFYGPYKGGQGRAMMSSCSAGQKSWEDPQLRHGVFTYFLTEALSGKADINRDGGVTFFELATSVHDNVQAWAQKNGKEQEPMLNLENFVASKTDIVIALSPATMPTGPLADKKRVVYARLDMEDADYACGLLEKPAPNEVEQKILKALDDMVAGKIKPERYLDFVRITRPAG